MWLAILGSALVCAVIAVIYLVNRFGHFAVVSRLAGNRRWLRILISCVPVLCLFVYGIFNIVNAVIIVLHLAAFWLIADLATGLFSFLRRRFSRKTPDAGAAAEAPADTADASENGPCGNTASPKIYWKGIVVLTLCAVYLAIGMYNAYHVDRTAYELTTDKELPGGKLRIAHIADSHIGTTFGGEGFAEYLKKIEAEKPDVLVFTGDFVDDGTTREEMVAACHAFAGIQTTYGIFFCFGNHDKGYYGNRGYTAEDIVAELTANGVTVLEDETVLVADTFYITGRMDKSDSERAKDGRARLPMEELTKDLDKSRYMIVLDHQPNDYAAESAAGADLVLSGHTHGGQLIPLGPIGRLMGANDRTYGTETRGNTSFIVTSGISDWEILFKTGTKSEYVIIDITRR